MVDDIFLEKKNEELKKSGAGGYFLNIVYYDSYDYALELRLCKDEEEAVLTEEALTLVLTAAVEILADEDVDTLNVFSDSPDYEAVFEKNRFFYEISDYIFAYPEKYAIIKNDDDGLYPDEDENEREYSYLHASCTVTERAHSIFIRNVFVEKEFRRQGMAGQMLKNIIEEYKESGKEILLHTDSSNPAAMNLYKKHGFMIKEERHSYIYYYE